MLLITRRRMLAAGGTLAAGLPRANRVRRSCTISPGDLVPTDPPVPAPDIIFVARRRQRAPSDGFVGHGMVINLWATWCVPCVAEMPSLAALSKTLAPDDIAVLPLSSDRGGARVVEAFYQDHGITGLPVLLDPKGRRRHGPGTCAASPPA